MKAAFNNSLFKEFYFLLFLGLFCFSLKSNAQTTIYVDTVTVGNGTASPYIEIDSNKIPLAIGIRLTEDALSGLPTSNNFWSINLPDVAVNSIFKHVWFYYTFAGHGPINVYMVPQFLFYFYMIPVSERVQIPWNVSGGDSVPIEPQFMPKDYKTLAGELLGGIGVNYLDSFSPELNEGKFTKTLAYGFYHGKMIFVGPMVTLEFLHDHPNGTYPIKQPQAYQQNGYYPTSYSIIYDRTKKEYNIFIHDFVLRSNVTGVNENKPVQPTVFKLLQNYPNPFNPTTVISWQLPVSSYVTLKVYDLLGRELATLVNKEQLAGNYKVEFNAGSAGGGLSSGIYLYRIHAGDFVSTKKLILLR